MKVKRRRIVSLTFFEAKQVRDCVTPNKTMILIENEHMTESVSDFFIAKEECFHRIDSVKVKFNGFSYDDNANNDNKTGKYFL